MRSNFNYRTEIFMILAFQFFLLGGAIVKLFSTNGQLSYLLVTLFALFINIFTMIIVTDLYKSIEIREDFLSIKKLFFPRFKLNKNEILGYWNYKTIGALGQEESVYLRLKNGSKIGFHAKAYKNFDNIKNGVKNFGLKNLGDYDYEKTNYKYFKFVFPMAILISVILFLLSNFLSE